MKINSLYIEIEPVELEEWKDLSKIILDAINDSELELVTWETGVVSPKKELPEGHWLDDWIKARGLDG